jgi:Carboxypeptidase regulatory-like domain
MPRSILLLFVLSLPIFSQTPAATSGRVEGQLVDAGTGAGIRKGWLTLRAGTAGYTTVSDANGNFVFEDVDPGRYSLSAEHSAYLRAANARGQITVAAHEVVKAGRIALTAQGVISGRVTDEGGDPLPGGVQVQVSRWHWDAQTGVRTLTQIKQTSADDQGNFRLSGLAAGNYFLSAYGGRTSAAFDDRTVMHGSEAYTTTYYPGASTPESSMPISVAAGADVANMNLTLRKMRVSRIHGTARDSSGQAANQVALHLIPLGAYPVSPLTNDAVAVVQNGVFEFPRVMAGNYIILAPDNAGSAHLVGRYDVGIAEADVSGILFPLGPGAAVEGHFKLDSGDAAPAGFIFALRSADGAGLNVASKPTPNPDGPDAAPRASGIPPGRYWIDVRGDSRTANAYVKSMHFGDADATLKPVEIGTGTQPGLDVLISPNGGSVSGTICNDKGESVAASQVVLAPVSRDLGGIQRLVKTAPAAQGTFRFAGIAPGDYLLLALEGGDPGASRDPAFREILADRGTKLTVQEGSMLTVEVPLISESIGEAALEKLQ